MQGKQNIEKHDSFAIVCNTEYVENKLRISDKRIVDISGLGYGLIHNSRSITSVEVDSSTHSSEWKIHNKIEGNSCLVNKKSLLSNMSEYYKGMSKNVFEYLPLTFHITSYEDFTAFKRETQGDEIWILKPGENSNRGKGIKLYKSIDEMERELEQNPYSHSRTYVIQKYVKKPFLINKRKFDIRCFALVTYYNGVVQGYFYNEGYLRTSSKEFSLKDLADKHTHLTNDAIQKKSEDYGKFEKGNKLSFKHFQKYLDGISVSLQTGILPGIRNIVKDTVKCLALNVQTLNSFEVFGYDFLIDDRLKPWLLEVNTNPCLELSCPLLARLIPEMLDNSLAIALDPLFPQPITDKRGSSLSSETLLQNKFELLFHSLSDF